MRVSRALFSRDQFYLVLVLPHLTTEDTVYDGYLIPKGSMLMASIKYGSLFTSTPTFPHPLPPKVHAPGRAFMGQPDRIQARKVPTGTQGRTS